MTPTVTLCETACAKINLYLRVGARRPDGFHDILTLMRGVSLSDILTCTFQKADETRVSVTVEDADAPLPADECNLAARGILAVLTAAGETAAVTVRLQKRIPTAAGLGGGSSDAAAAMRATNRWLGGRFSDTELEQMAAAIGSDVPFFVTGQTALCSGRGELLTPVPAAFDGACVILAGREPSATAAAYAALDAARHREACDGPIPDTRKENSHTAPVRKLCPVSDRTAETQSQSTADTAVPSLPDFTRFSSADIHNDFEAPVSRLCPSVPLHLAALCEVGATAAAMSGSGSATFGLFPSLTEAESAASSLRDKGFTAFAATLL